MAFPYPYSSPIAYLNNLPIHPDWYKPRVFEISFITLGQTTLITTENDQDYVVGQQVKFLIPQGWGCRQLNNQTGYVTSVNSINQFEVNIDSSQMDAFISSTINNVPQVIAVGDVNSGFISSTGRIWPSLAIPGSFQNISH